MHGSSGGGHSPLRRALLRLKHAVGVPVVDTLGASEHHGDNVVAGRNISIGVLNSVKWVLPGFLSSLSSQSEERWYIGISQKAADAWCGATIGERVGDSSATIDWALCSEIYIGNHIVVLAEAGISRLPYSYIYDKETHIYMAVTFGIQHDP